jgi:hypothetical protein
MSAHFLPQSAKVPRVQRIPGRHRGYRPAHAPMNRNQVRSVVRVIHPDEVGRNRTSDHAANVLLIDLHEQSTLFLRVSLLSGFHLSKEVGDALAGVDELHQIIERRTLLTQRVNIEVGFGIAAEIH